LSIVIILGGILFLYLLVTKPDAIAILFFPITIADINFELGGLPMNARALIGLALFGRTIISAKNEMQKGFLSNSKTLLIVAFTFYTILVTAFNDLVTAAFIKQSFLTLIAVYCGYFYYMKRGDMLYLKISLVLAGIICFFDLGYTYKMYGEFPVQRIYQLLWFDMRDELCSDNKSVYQSKITQKTHLTITSCNVSWRADVHFTKHFIGYYRDINCVDFKGTETS
jgi:hypothetical protein